jgi:perosamine synthetase
MIPVTVVKTGLAEEELVLSVLRSGQLAQGSLVEEFEVEFARRHDVAHAVAVNNGTTALIAAIRGLGIGPGDEVVTSPFTFVATLNAILDAGATARFADIGADFNIMPAAIEAVMSSRTSAVMPVHLYGQPADIDEIMALAETHQLGVIEDAAQAVGARYRGRGVGSFGVGCFSLYATKNITTGEGGMVTTNDDAVADRIRVLRNQGMRQRYQYEMAGNNYRLTNLAAAVGLPQLRQLDTITERRQTHADFLRSELDDIPGLVLPPPCPADRTHVYHQFTVRITGDAPISRDEFIDQLHHQGVGSGIYYPRVVFDYDCYRNHPRVVIDEVPNAFCAAEEVVSLPVHPYLTDQELETITKSVRSAMSA